MPVKDVLLGLYTFQTENFACLKNRQIFDLIFRENLKIIELRKIETD